MQRHGMYRDLDDTDWTRAQQSRMEDLQRAYNIFLATGEVTTQELADALGLPMGTITWDRNFGQQQLALQHAQLAARGSGGGSRSWRGSDSVDVDDDFDWNETYELPPRRITASGGGGIVGSGAVHQLLYR
jgi:hypothetical protein